MGGSIGVTIRKSNGEEIRRCRWTNALPSVFNNVRFLTQDESYLKEYIERGEGMRNDWLKNKDSEKFEFNMTPVYGPYDTLAPVEYGLVVIDYKTKHILSLQGYCNAPNVLPEYFVFAGIRRNGNKLIFREVMDDDKESHQLVKEFFDQKRVKSYFLLAEKEGLDEFPINYEDYKDFEDFLLKMSKFREENRYFFQLGIDTKDWTVIKFKEEKEGYIEMKKYLQENLGFKLSEEEEKEWSDLHLH